MAASSKIEGLENRIQKIGTREEIQEILDKRGITLDSLIGQLQSIAFNTIGDYFAQDKYGRFVLTLDSLSNEQMAGISEVMVDISAMIPHPKDPKQAALKCERIKIKIANKSEALMALVRLRAGDIGAAGARGASKSAKETDAAPPSMVGSRLATALSQRKRLEAEADSKDKVG